MLKNYLITAFRNLKKRFVFSVLNVFGLALGISCVVFIYSFITHELSYEKHIPKADRLYRLTHTSIEENITRYWAPTAPLLPEMMQQQLPEIETFTRVFPTHEITLYLPDSSSTPKKIKEEFGYFVDTSFFQMFDIQFIAGDPQSSLKEATGIVVSESLANRLFGANDPMGQIITIETYNRDYIITGIMKERPGNTHLKVNFVLSFSSFREYLIARGLEGIYYSRTWAGPYNYILLKPGASIEELEKKMPDFIASYLSEKGTREEILARHAYPMQPISKIHLYSKLEQEISPNGDIRYIYIFALVAVLILLIAGVNYVNISTAQALRRIKEMGIRKVVGANRSQVLWQNLGESLLICLMGGFLAVLLIDVLYPYYNRISGLDQGLREFFSFQNLLLMGGIVLVLSFVSGIYPAFLASGFTIEDNIKGFRKVGSFSHQLRRVLVIVQFSISVFLIFNTLVLNKQINLFLNQDLGFNKENVVAVSYGAGLFRALQNDRGAVKAEILSNPDMLVVSTTSNLPGQRTSVEDLDYIGIEEDNLPSQRFIRVDEDYLECMQIELLEGPGFERNSDSLMQFLVNERSVVVSGIEDPIGKKAENMWGNTGKVVGIVRNHNFASLHEAIEPLVLEYHPQDVIGPLLVRFKGTQREALEYLEKKLKTIAPEDVLEFRMITDQWDSLYETEMNAADTFKAFTFLAILISCIGLFGLAAYTSELRIKEMGIRKVHGASLTAIARIFGLDFLKLILVSVVLALPLAWLVMDQWLNNFQYRMHFNGSLFLLSILVILFVSMITISYQLMKISRANPVNYIQYE
jgi:putative ABC transport system permease protein